MFKISVDVDSTRTQDHCKMDYEKLIEENECLKTYFTEFPKKLMQLAIEVMEYTQNVELITNFQSIFKLSSQRVK